jgi:hypothetical protein
MCLIPDIHVQAIEESIVSISLSQPQRNLLIKRYLSVLKDYRNRKVRYSVSFHVLRTIITVGSLIVPALLSVQYTSGNTVTTSTTISSEVYWIVWVLSLFVTISNGIMSLLKIDKKYFVFHTVFEQLLSEGWQYIELSGRYSGQHTPGVTVVNHVNQFTYFCHMIEKIRMKQVEDEYYKVMEHSNHVGRTTNESLVPLTPFRGVSVTTGVVATNTQQNAQQTFPPFSGVNTQQEVNGSGSETEQTQQQGASLRRQNQETTESSTRE